MSSKLFIPWLDHSLIFVQFLSYVAEGVLEKWEKKIHCAKNKDYPQNTHSWSHACITHWVVGNARPARQSIAYWRKTKRTGYHQRPPLNPHAETDGVPGEESLIDLGLTLSNGKYAPEEEALPPKIPIEISQVDNAKTLTRTWEVAFLRICSRAEQYDRRWRYRQRGAARWPWRKLRKLRIAWI